VRRKVIRNEEEEQEVKHQEKEVWHKEDEMLVCIALI
jgi:hypothetical protein